ncbi:MAG: hypothetical protein IPF53_11955 [Blastocatellia bacterium]|nr:hypothetical protein [Blastocatellia bacterium]
MYSADGTLASEFDGDGRLTNDLFTNDDRIKGVVVQPDGKIAVGGHGFKDDGYSFFVVARYNTDGTLDPGFGTGGAVVTDLPGDEERIFELGFSPTDASSLADGQATRCTTSPSRYNTDGSLDTTFRKRRHRHGTSTEVTTKP